jgi:hypothetical protein
MFLDVVTAGRVIREEQRDGDLGAGVSIQSSGSESDNSIDEGNDPTLTKKAIASPSSEPLSSLASTAVAQPSARSLPQTTTALSSSLDAELTQEKLASLSLLNSLFGNQRSDGWMGQESVGSDIDDAEVERLKKEGGRGNVDTVVQGVQEIEEVPMDIDHAGHEMDVIHEGVVAGTREAQAPDTVVDQRNKAPVQSTKLKDLFAPREEEGSLCLSFFIFHISHTRLIHSGILPPRPPRPRS